MAVYHKKYKNTGLNAFGQSFTIDADGLLSPTPDDETAAKLCQLGNYKLVEDAPKAKAKAKKAEAVAEEAPAEEKKEPAKKAAPKKKPAKKKAAAKKAK